VTQPRIHALVGQPAKYPQPAVRFPSHSARLAGFKLVCTGPDKKLVAESPPTDLRMGWNLITLPIQEHRRSFLVYGGAASEPDKRYEKPSPKK
jgi:hypothetical protein